MTEIVQARRIFRLGSLRLPDPDPSLPPEEAVRLYAAAYPQVAQAEIGEPEVSPDGELVYEVQRPPAKTKG